MEENKSDQRNNKNPVRSALAKLFFAIFTPLYFVAGYTIVCVMFAATLAAVMWFIVYTFDVDTNLGLITCGFLVLALLLSMLSNKVRTKIWEYWMQVWRNY
jgi:hypothetical protein